MPEPHQNLVNKRIEQQIGAKLVNLKQQMT